MTMSYCLLLCIEPTLTRVEKLLQLLHIFNIKPYKNRSFLIGLILRYNGQIIELRKEWLEGK